MIGSKSYSKTKELIIYVAHVMRNKPNYGFTLLNKALYFIDNISYLKTGKPISELSYIKQDWGPTPEPSLFLLLRDQLENEGEITIVKTEFFGRIQKKVLATREPVVDQFTKEEIILMDAVLSSIENWTGIEASEFSHQFPAWQAATKDEPLPFYTFLISSTSATSSDMEWAKSELRSVRSNPN